MTLHLLHLPLARLTEHDSSSSSRATLAPTTTSQLEIDFHLSRMMSSKAAAAAAAANSFLLLLLFLTATGQENKEWDGTGWEGLHFVL